jgi:hypothetical protein
VGRPFSRRPVNYTTFESEVFDWVRTLLAEGYGVSTDLTQDGDVFGDYDRMTAWFMAPPYPHHLGDRLFAKRSGEHSSDRTESGTAPDPEGF